MKISTKIYISIVTIAVIAVFSGALWRSHKINVLEHVVSDAKAAADEQRQLAGAKEREAAEYKSKIEYLERQLADIQTQTRKQNEKLEKLNVHGRNALERVERAKRTRTVNADSTELCAKLAEVGHPCEQ